MSVIPMKLVTLAGPVTQFDHVVRSCIINREFQPENALQLMRDVQNLRPFERNNPYLAALRKAESLSEVGNILENMA